jgi:hypothetical protein
MSAKQVVKKKEKSYWLEIIVLVLIFLLIIYLKTRFSGDTISPYDGFMAVWRN